MEKTCDSNSFLRFPVAPTNRRKKNCSRLVHVYVHVFMPHLLCAIGLPLANILSIFIFHDVNNDINSNKTVSQLFISFIFLSIQYICKLF